MMMTTTTMTIMITLIDDCYNINADDRDIPKLLRTFSFKGKEEITELLAVTLERPHERAAQRALAIELTELVHGRQEREGAEAAGKALFGQGELGVLSEAVLSASLQQASYGQVESSEIVEGELPGISDLLVRCGLVTSKSAARRTIDEGGAYVNNERITDETWRPTTENLLYGRWLVLRRGKKNVGGIEVVSG